MSIFGGGGAKPPPPPPPPPNPPTYASALSTSPSQNLGGIYAGMGQSILTSPFGPEDQRATQRKSLLGQ